MQNFDVKLAASFIGRGKHRTIASEFIWCKSVSGRYKVFNINVLKIREEQLFLNNVHSVLALELRRVADTQL